MTDSLNTAAKGRTAKDNVPNKVKMGSLELLASLRITRNTVIIGIVVAAMVTGIGFANALITVTAHAFTSQQCPRIPVKMFDNLNVPKYFIGPGYKVIPIDLKETKVMVTICK